MGVFHTILVLTPPLSPIPQKITFFCGKFQVFVVVRLLFEVFTVVQLLSNTVAYLDVIIFPQF